MSVILPFFPSWANTNIIGKVLRAVSSPGQRAPQDWFTWALHWWAHEWSSKSLRNCKELDSKKEVMRNILAKFSPETVRTDGGEKYKIKTNVGSCFSKWGQDVFLLYSTQRETHCLNIIKGRKDNKAFQNSFLIFFTADNKVLSCFFSVQY